MVVAQVALVLAKPRKQEYDDGLYHSDDNLEYFVYKRAGKTHLSNDSKLFFFRTKVRHSYLGFGNQKWPAWSR